MKNSLVSYGVMTIEKKIVIPNQYVTVERTLKVDR